MISDCHCRIKAFEVNQFVISGYAWVSAKWGRFELVGSVFDGKTIKDRYERVKRIGGNG